MRKKSQKENIASLNASLPALTGGGTASSFHLEEIKKDPKQINILRLIWELIRRDERYKNDYKELRTKPSQEYQKAFYAKWRVDPPLEPESTFNPGYGFILSLRAFLADRAVMVIAEDYDVGMLRLEINLNCSPPAINKKVKKIVLEAKELFTAKQRTKKSNRLFNHSNLSRRDISDFTYYEKLFAVYDCKYTQKGAERTWGQSLQEAQRKRIEGVENIRMVRNFCRAFTTLRNRLRVPLKE